MPDAVDLESPAAPEDGFAPAGGPSLLRRMVEHPELRLADKIAANVSVPVDVESLLARHADLLLVDMPPSLDVDAVVIGLDGRPARPRVLLNKNRDNELRRRFTLAHELAHILLPWHIGTIGCTTQPGIGQADEWAAQLEAEANRFAARLLIPQDWLLEYVVPTSNGHELLRRLAEAGASALPSLLRLVPELPYGWMFSLLRGEESGPDRVFRSPGSFMPPVTGRSGLNDRHADAAGRFGFASRTVLWWHWRPVVPPYPELPPLSSRARRPIEGLRRDQLREVATRLLREALANYGRDENDIPHFAGLTGAVIDATRIRTAPAIDCALRQRFSNQAEHGPVIQDPTFRRYLAARAWQWSITPSV